MIEYIQLKNTNSQIIEKVKQQMKTRNNWFFFFQENYRNEKQVMKDNWSKWTKVLAFPFVFLSKQIVEKMHLIREKCKGESTLIETILESEREIMRKRSERE